jgi:PRTRC genetic system ThiF family protein
MKLTVPERWLTQSIRVTLAGVGGTGSQVVDQLASLDALLRQLGHPGFRVRAYDADTVSRFNLGRQRFAAPDVGLSKAQVLAHRIRLFYATDIEAHTRHLDAGEASCDLLITCTDSAAFRAAVGNRFRKRSTDALWLDFGNGNESAQAVIGHLGQPTVGPRVPNVADLFPALGDMAAADAQAPSCSMEEAVRRQPWPLNRVVAIAGMTMLERLVRTGALSYHGSLIQLDPYTVQPLPVDPVMWGMYGYCADASTVKANPRRRAA